MEAKCHEEKWPPGAMTGVKETVIVTNIVRFVLDLSIFSYHSQVNEFPAPLNFSGTFTCFWRFGLASLGRWARSSRLSAICIGRSRFIRTNNTKFL